MIREHVRVGGIYRLNGNKAKDELVRVFKINQKNVKCKTQAGVTWNAHPSFLSEVTSEEAAAFGSSASVAAAGPALVLGSAVRYIGSSTRMKQHMADWPPVLVIVGERSGLFRAAPLGGRGGQYVTGLEASDFEVVNFELAGL